MRLRARQLRSAALGLSLAAAMLGSAPSDARATAEELEADLEADLEAVARVTSSASELRVGPGLGYRVVHRAQRGDAFVVQGREATGFWLRVYLADGRTAYLLGDTAETVFVSELEGASPGTPGVFAPPPLESAWGGMTLAGGLLDGAGYAELKPAFVLSPALSIEPYVGLAMSPAGRSLLYGVAGTLNLAPDWAVAPYLGLGGGGFSRLPNDDAFALRRETLLHARAGGGFIVSLRWRIALRVEGHNAVFFDADTYTNAQSYVVGLGSYF